MIVFDLKCSAGHVFEAWFGSSQDWEDQQSRRLVSCPLCGVADVAKAAMAPAVPAKGNRAAPQAAPIMKPGEEGPEGAQIKAILTALARAQREAIKKADYVGARFADEARAIHLGEAEERGIYGEATQEETRSLLDEGIDIVPLLVPARGRPDS